jgi:hypothetical protein
MTPRWPLRSELGSQVAIRPEQQALQADGFIVMPMIGNQGAVAQESGAWQGSGHLQMPRGAHQQKPLTDITTPGLGD